jgi:hypothetical protein
MLAKPLLHAVCMLLFSTAQYSTSLGQDTRQAPQTKGAPAAKSPQPVPPGASVPAMPSVEELIYLIRNLGIAINQANVTDNYTVLLALSAPEFRAVTTTDNLRTQFSSLRQRSVDFAVTLAVAPQFSTIPSVDPSGILRLTGYFPTTPRITFDFGFKMYDGRWLPIGYGIGVINNPPPDRPPEPAKKGSAPPTTKKPPEK